jgi:glutamate dehydrogenase
MTNPLKKTTFDLSSNQDSLEPIEATDYEGMLTGQDLQEYVAEITKNVESHLDQNIAALAPWFFSVMPPVYYQTTPRAEKVRHFAAVVTGHIFETKQRVELWNNDRSKVTYMGPGVEQNVVTDIASQVKSFDMKMGSIYFSRDRLLFLSTFTAKSFKPIDKYNQHLNQKLSRSYALISKNFPKLKDEIDYYIEHLDNDFVADSTADRIATTFKMLQYMKTHEGAHTFFDSLPNNSSAKITFGLKGLRASEIMENIFHLIDRYGFDIGRSFYAIFEEGYEEPINIMDFIISQKSSQPISPNDPAILKLGKALRTLGWVDFDNYTKLSYSPYLLSLNGTNLLRAMGSYIHILLGKENPYYYSDDKIFRTFMDNDSISQDLVELFRLKFDPDQADQRKNKELENKQNVIEAKIQGLTDIISCKILRECLKFIDNTIKTNYFLHTKTGLAFRLKPDVLDSKYYPDKPYGIFFIIGRDYRFFHVRWKDIARGGLRVVMPKNNVDHNYAMSGLFDEVYGLSRAQQLKNKDIPEGGSKAVLVLNPQGNKNRAVRGAINALLDLLVQEDESHENQKHLVSYDPAEEIIYLGPDENITNDLIQWIPAQAKRRNYPYALAFMSSKPTSGINHKEYGVTSEGLQVFLDHTLNFLKIDPKKQSFRIKMTGGPDGDVAGNGLKIFYREYGENAKIVAISDGYGAAHDPNGLAWTELLRLVEEGKPISHFPKSSLSSNPDSFVILADHGEGIRIRNELHQKAEAEIFFPAGGRPYTVHEENYQGFINPVTQKPTCLGVVEGANIFFTDGARTKLQELGLFMIKDSSANKTGVICSSYEIIASLLLTEDEFAHIKPQYVKQVIERLRHKAANEAKLLFSAYKLSNKPLVTLSMQISKEINNLTDLLLEELTKIKETLLNESIFREILIHHCPLILIETFPDRWKKLPLPHIVAICASSIASYIVYQEGLGFLDSIPQEQKYRVAINYMKQNSLANQLVHSVEESNLPYKEQIAQILRKNAARDLTIQITST